MTERTQTKTPSGSSGSDAEQDTPFRDTSEQRETVAELEQKRADALRAEQGRDDPLGDEDRERLHEAKDVLAEQRTARVGAQGEGGGPWPPELRSRFFNPTGRTAQNPAAAYTSHEQ